MEYVIVRVPDGCSADWVSDLLHEKLWSAVTVLAEYVGEAVSVAVSV
jgi:hypothetical protein